MDVLTAPRSMPENSVSMSARVSTATPARPTSPLARGSSESRPSKVGMSKAVDSPSPPERSSSLKRPLVSAAVPKPANWRIVHRRERYMDAYGPTGVGELPGQLGPLGPVDRFERHARHGLERAPAAWANGRRSPATLPGQPSRHTYFNIKVNPSAQSKSPAARRRWPGSRTACGALGCVQPQVGEHVGVHGHRGPLGHRDGPAAVMAASVPRPSSGLGWRVHQALSLEPVDGVGHAGRVDLQALPDLAQRQASPSSRTRGASGPRSGRR